MCRDRMHADLVLYVLALMLGQNVTKGPHRGHMLIGIATS